MQRFQAPREVTEFMLSANMEIKIRVTGSLCGQSVSPGYSTRTPYRSSGYLQGKVEKAVARACTGDMTSFLC